MNKILRISLFSLLAMLSSTIYAETEKFVFTGDEAYWIITPIHMSAKKAM